MPWNMNLVSNAPPAVQEALLNAAIVLRAGHKYNMGFDEVFLVTKIGDVSPPTHICIFTNSGRHYLRFIILAYSRYLLGR
jgi:hypothetical protein